MNITLAPATHAYVGRMPCGCVVAAQVDNAERRADIAETIGEWIMDGWTVERVSIEDARVIVRRCRCDEQKTLFGGDNQ